MKTIAFAILAAAGLSAAAHAQTPLPLTNSGFEVEDPFAGRPDPLGWHNLGPSFDFRRVVGDGEQPPVTPHGGQACIQLSGSGGFNGFTTDTLNFFDPNLPYYDPVFDYGPNGGDIVVTGWYMIPANAEIHEQPAGVKLNVKRFFQDYATVDPWGDGGTTFSGHTSGVWTFFEVRWTMANIREQVAFNDTLNCGGTGEPCSGCFQDCPPIPERCKITFGRFGGVGDGIIFFDDITYGQEGVPPACPADFNGDGFLDFFDFDSFVACFEGTECPPGKDADYNGDGFPDFFDYDEFVGDFEAGC